MGDGSVVVAHASDKRVPEELRRLVGLFARFVAKARRPEICAVASAALRGSGLVV